MALLLFSCVRPLTGRMAVVLRMVSTPFPVRTLRTSVSSHATPIFVAMKRPSLCQILFPHESALIGMRQCGRCFTSQCSGDGVSSVGSVSKSDSLKTEEKHLMSKTSKNCTENADIEQGDFHSTRDVCSEEGKMEFLSVSEQQTHSPYGFSSDTAESSQKENISLANPSDSISALGIDYSCNEHIAVTLTDSHPACPDTTSVPMPAEEEDVQELPPARPMEPSFTLVPYVAQSPVLQKLVALGVDLSAVEKVKEAADFLVQADWDANIQPKLLFLRDVGVEDSQLGAVLTKNPLLLKEDVEDMQGRIKYFESKKFSQEQITRIMTSAPLTLLLPVTYVDKKLGFLQKSFYLTGDEVRLVASRLPKILPWKLQKLKDIRFYMKEMLGFSDRELKAMLLASPRVFLSDRHKLGKKFDLLHNIMGLSHQHLTAWPAVFRTRLHIVEQRHRFLLLLGRAQYDPTKENYVSLQALVSGRDRDFCFHVAKAPTSQFYSFLKSL